MAAAAILDFQIMWIWPFRRVDSVAFVFCTKFGSDSHWDRRTYAEDVHLMTSRKLCLMFFLSLVKFVFLYFCLPLYGEIKICKLTSGFDFWSRGHLRMAVMHLHIKFGADIFIQSGVIVIFQKFKMAAAAILDF